MKQKDPFHLCTIRLIRFDTVPIAVTFLKAEFGV